MPENTTTPTRPEDRLSRLEAVEAQADRIERMLDEVRELLHERERRASLEQVER